MKNMFLFTKLISDNYISVGIHSQDLEIKLLEFLCLATLSRGENSTYILRFGKLIIMLINELPYIERGP